MKKNSICNAVFTFIILAILGCAENGSQSNQTIRKSVGFGPFKAGNVWLYKYVQDTDSLREWYRKVEAVDTILKEGLTYVDFRIWDSSSSGSIVNLTDSLVEGYRKKGCQPTYQACPYSAWYPDEIEENIPAYLFVNNSSTSYKIYLQTCLYGQSEHGSTVNSISTSGFVDSTMGLLFKRSYIGGNPYTTNPCNSKKCSLEIKLIEFNGTKLNVDDVIKQVDTTVTKPYSKPSC